VLVRHAEEIIAREKLPAPESRAHSEKEIRVDFPGFSGEDSLEPIEWDEWFQKFDEQKLAFLYQQGKNTNFNKLVRRDPDEVRPSDRRRGPSRTTRCGRAKPGRTFINVRAKPASSDPRP
jgi:hypothetical protein